MSARERLLAALTVSPEVRAGDAEQLLDEVAIEDWPGELATLRAALSAVRTATQQGSLPFVQFFVSQYYAIERTALDDAAGDAE
ncbi:hypothetical protein ACGFW5_30950 [Streptomyces sp. NPDC048416]|uniref:hypothetical protein n=1 Tax=Streptomyces sp. NPDC048416 TaxID=3365546 RepID=UPI003711E6CF